MKETLVDLKERRSCRKYLPQQITDEQLNAILEAGTYAPTGMGKQSPVIVVLQKPELIAEVAKMNAAVMGRDDNPFTARRPCLSCLRILRQGLIFTTELWLWEIF